MSSSESHGPGVEVVKREKVLSDLMILENQIPFVVLQTLSNILLFPPEVDIPRWIYERALSILGYSPRDFTTIYTPEFKAFHFLELVHLIVGKEKDETKEKERLKERKDVKLALTNGSVEVGKLKLQRCATRLKAAGVIIIKPSETMIEASSPNMAAATRFNLQILNG
ncbi:hypothetical protein VNO78_26007 [Psophocarpus tetragonolobus]|uniref:Uncharacterized protein n=1 Tax=Psophocarpus tetragonolobus TaxID=3891 RepID=A0AAN9S8Q6_PSOTE